MAIKEVLYNNNKFQISYELANLDCSCDIVFLHGWGSNKELMQSAFGNTLSHYRHIYIDMPGFGRSSNDLILHTVDYANIIREFLNIIGSQPSVIVGHSFGGKVATLLNPKNLVLLSTAGIVEKKPLKIKVKICLTKILNLLGFKEFTKIFRTKDAQNLPQNMYETLKNVVNEDFSGEFEKFENTALIFWGKEDKATSLESGKKIAKLIKNSNFHILNGDHYFFLKHSKFITGIIDGLD
ncbi:alpha/beta fold hydrolase [Arcobacter sp. FWKO B]|uniref:alpha/beta fold hydrolase n=1 Tax=Arcobacter sp. FWKO B TaxID=2593672 RepID=UPI0018A504E8|nr:alpha/beta hydrolase [Arcobacter sp. FWKO B]QOG11529.1 alpha/beta hydrolase [Arcobacter sp. FWKO B]